MLPLAMQISTMIGTSGVKSDRLESQSSYLKRSVKRLVVYGISLLAHLGTTACSTAPLYTAILNIAPVIRTPASLAHPLGKLWACIRPLFLHFLRHHP